MNIADIFAAVHLNLDTGKFEADALKSTTLVAGKMGASLKRAAGGMLGAGVGAAFGAMLTGANQLDAATRQLQADTGMTADEAKRAQGALAGMYRGNLQGFDAIGAAMAKVHNDLGLTGDAADKATAKFLKFSTATGQDAAAAVTSFDDILDAWNLTAADTGPLMDGLIADHQKFGGVVGESQAALAAMAPAMQAANMSIDDGRALLNLFNAAGIDAAKAPAALARAVKLLKPGQSLDDLIAQISSIEDPTLRGQKAMEIFGAKGGIQLAQAFKPGIKSLDDFAVSAQDAAGSTETAAGVIESGFGAQFQLIMKNAGGALAEFGTQFGPLLMVASAFGPQFITKLGAGLGGLAGFFGPKLLAKILPQAVATGTASGTAMGTAFSAAVAAAFVAAPLAVLAVGISIQNDINKQGEALITQAGAFATKASDADLQNAIAGVRKQLDGMVFNTFDSKNKVIGVLNTLIAESNRRATEVGTAAATGLRYGLAGGAPAALEAAEKLGAAIPPAIGAGITLTATPETIGADEVVAMFGTSLDGIVSASFSTGTDGMLAMAAGIADARAKPLDAFGTLVEMLKHALTPAAEQARLAGQLTSEELARGLRSKDPEVRAQAIAVKRSILERLRELAQSGKPLGAKAMAELNKGLRSKDPQIRAAAAAAKKIVVDKLNETAPAARTAGAAAAGAFVAGMLARLPAFLRKAITAQLHAAGFPGYSVGSWEIPTTELAMVHRKEMIIPAPAAEAVRAGQAAVTAQGIVGRGAGGDTYQVNVTGLVRARDPLEIATQMRRLATFGVLTPRRVPA